MNALNGPDTRFALDTQGLDSLKAQAKTDADAALKTAAKQFESIFLSMMLKSMRKAMPEGGLFESSQTKAYQGMMDQQWSQHLSGKGFGLADQLVRQIKQAQAVASKAPEPPTAFIPGPSVTKTTIKGETQEQQLTSTTNALVQQQSNSEPNKIKTFIDRFGQEALAAGKQSRLPGLVLLAQAALETGWGEKPIPTEKGQNSFNLFGIKAGSKWQGNTTRVTTTEYQGAKASAEQAEFRVYENYQAAFKDYADLITQSPRYQNVVKAGQDEHQVAKALQDSGYATDPEYANKLVSIMDRIRREGDL